MKYVFLINDKIGDIVVKLPKAGEIFKEFKIDFCCGGGRPLSEAIKEQGLNEEEILLKLQKAYEKMQDLKDESNDWENASFSDLIDHVVNTHHAYLNEVLPKLSQLTKTIYRVHGSNHSELSKVYKLFHALKMELEEHLIKEEEIVFPLIKEYESNSSAETLDKALKTIEELEKEHDAAGDIIKELRKITDNYTIPSDGCESYNLTYRGLELLESDIFQHIHLENNIMFPKFAELKK